MIRALLIGLAGLLFALPASAQLQSCACATPPGCLVTADPYAGDQLDTPTYCSVYSTTFVLLGTAAVVQASTIPLMNNEICSPPAPAYVPGAATNVACLVLLPTSLPLGRTTITMTAGNHVGESGHSNQLTFVNVATLPQWRKPTVPSGIRITGLETIEDIIEGAVALADRDVALLLDIEMT